MRERSQTAATRVLVVDDDTGARAALSGLLRADGYDVATAADGYKALDRAEEWVPNIVITDVKMPALGGIELMRRLKERLPDVAVAVATGPSAAKSDPSRVAASALPQATLTSGPRRPLHWWSLRARVCLPVPHSPVKSTGIVAAASSSASARTSRKSLD